jgi:flagellar biosynthesis/type III secretory pathway ATPase
VKAEAEVTEEAEVKEEEPVHESRVRILNAMGEVVEDETIKEEPRTFADLTTADGPPMSREEALRVLKRGVAELASTMESSVP